MLKELILKNRSYRTFDEDHKVEKETLKELIDLARVSTSSMNLQPLKYIISNDKETNDFIFRNLRWAGYIRKWQGPVEGERPASYIIMLIDRKVRYTGGRVDAGIAMNSIMLGATEKGLGGCTISAINQLAFRQKFNLPDHLEIMLVLCIGKPKGDIIIEETDDEVVYYVGQDGIPRIPKRKLEDIILDPKELAKKEQTPHSF